MRRHPIPGREKCQLHDKISFISLSSKAFMPGMTIEQHHFRRVCGKFATGITIVTILDSVGTPYGMTANSFTSVSLTPPLILVSIDLKSSILAHFRPGTPFAVNVLGEEHRELSSRFARSSQDRRFDGIAWSPGETGAPILAGMLATVECAVTQMVEAGDHVVVIGEALHATWREGRPLLYFNSGYDELRKET
jgi:flavin reductase (DIM6/NTAB) family NADH-FMN oxidoreductase RutF